MRKLSKIGYENYQKAYEAKMKKFSKKGFTFYDKSGMYTYDEWEAMYKAKRLDRLELVKYGKAKTIGNINQYLVAEQAYHESFEQAKKLQVAAKNLGHRLTLTDIRGGKMPFDEIQNLYDELKKAGYTGTAAKDYISYNLFESL